MDKQQIIKRIIELSQSPTSNLLNPNGALGWMGQTSGIQQQVNDALNTWLTQGDSQPLIGSLGTMVVMGALSDQEAGHLQIAITSIDT